MIEGARVAGIARDRLIKAGNCGLVALQCVQRMTCIVLRSGLHLAMQCHAFVEQSFNPGVR